MSTMIDKLSAHQLAQLLTLDESSPWIETDLTNVLRCQLEAPVLPDLAAVPDIAPLLPAIQRRFVAKGIPLDKSFADHLRSPTADLELLDLIKQFARRMRDETSSPLRGAPATVLYYAAIAGAWLSCRARISQVTDNELRERFAWASRQKGAESLRTFFSAAVAALPPSASQGNDSGG